MPTAAKNKEHIYSIARKYPRRPRKKIHFANIQMEFSRSLYNTYDVLGKDTAQNFFRQQGYTITDTSEAYGSHDFIMERDGKSVKVEVEVKRGWKTLHFPFPTHDVPHRKHTSKADIFVQVNHNGSALAYCPMAAVKASKTYVKNTCYTRNERFFAVPTSAMTYMENDQSIWSSQSVQPSAV